MVLLGSVEVGLFSGRQLRRLRLRPDCVRARESRREIVSIKNSYGGRHNHRHIASSLPNALPLWSLLHFLAMSSPSPPLTALARSVLCRLKFCWLDHSPMGQCSVEKSHRPSLQATPLQNTLSLFVDCTVQFIVWLCSFIQKKRRRCNKKHLSQANKLGRRSSSHWECRARLINRRLLHGRPR